MADTTRLRDLRKATGKTIKYCTELCGVPYRTWQNWELGERECPEYVFNMIKEKLARIEVADVQISDKRVTCVLTDTGDIAINVPVVGGRVPKEIIGKLFDLNETYTVTIDYK